MKLPPKTRLSLNLFLILLLLIIHFMFRVVDVSGFSMSPTYDSNTITLATRYPNLFGGIEPKKDIILFKKNNEYFVKRVVYSNTKGYFVVGDNVYYSYDSRDFGLVTKEEVLGKLVFPRKAPKNYPNPEY